MLPEYFSWIHMMCDAVPFGSMFHNILLFFMLLSDTALHCAARSCVFPLSSALMLLYEPERDTQCYTSWQTFGAACYYISSRRGSWDTAHQDCLERGAHLTIVDNRQELVGNTPGYTPLEPFFWSTSLCLSIYSQRNNTTMKKDCHYAIATRTLSWGWPDSPWQPGLVWQTQGGRGFGGGLMEHQ